MINTRTRYYILFFIALYGFMKLIMSAYSLSAEFSIGKDFTQEYLMGKAVLSGLDPYLPLPQLEEFFPLPGRPELFEHPSAHPPISALLGLPFAFLPYLWAAGAWFSLELILVLLSCYFLVKWWDTTNIYVKVSLFFFILFCWEPIYAEVFTGQLNSLLLLLMILCWLCLRGGREIPGGMFLGFAIAIKLFLWPIYILLIMRRQWHATLVSTISFIVLNLFTLFLMGSDSLLRYYTTTNSTVWPIWRGHEANFSMWSLGWRIFDGTHGRGDILTIIPPIYPSVTYAQTLSAAAPIIMLGIGVFLIMHTKSYDHSYSLAICLSILLSPVAWSHYLILTLLPLTILMKQIFTIEQLHINVKIKFLSLSTTLLLVSPGYNLSGLSYLFSTIDRSSLSNATIIHMPFYAGLLTLIPLFALISLILLIYNFDKLTATCEQHSLV